MPIIRKIIPLGNSKAVTLPKTWLQYIEEKTGQGVKAVTMEVNGALTIKPKLKDQGKPQNKEGENG
jgi:antitoxin component of MazEF toxin-antitoxin module